MAKSVLVLYGFHPEEEYAKRIGMRLAELNLKGVVVRESPRRRSFKRLRKKYNADWIIDLHNYRNRYDPEFHNTVVADICHYPYLGWDDEWDEYGWLLEEACEHFTTQYRIRHGDDQHHHVIIGDLYKRECYKRYFGIELYPWVPEEESLNFLKEFIEYVKSLDL